MSVSAPAAPKVTRRSEYAPPLYYIDTVSLDFNITEGLTTVTSTMALRPRGAAAASPSAPPALVLHCGKDVSVQSVSIGGQAVAWSAGEGTLEVPLTPQQAPAFSLTTVSHIVPEKNTELEGLYRSSEGMYCTQCEAEGFRAITPFIDRPDNLSRFTVRLEADRGAYPVLLSNGDCTERGLVAGGGGRHYAVWVDPFPKPSYLFALVAGDLVSREDSYTTVPSGKPVALKLWTKAHDWSKGAWAMESIKKAMAWDERRFGLEYDLSEFNVVAVSDFNMGAMENKSLNIFNSRLVMATPTTATDVDFGRIEGVIVSAGKQALPAAVCLLSHPTPSPLPPFPPRATSTFTTGQATA
jgi:aminopeptidase N